MEKIDIRSRTLRHTYGVAANAPVEEARSGLPDDWIEKHKYKSYDGMRVRDLFEPFVKKGETVKLNEVTGTSSSFFVRSTH